MPVSAYDASGRLKKHALAGTSLGADPGRAAERAQYGELFAEAREHAGEGREYMRRKLSQRFGQYAKPQQARLDAIAKKRAGFEEQARALRDREKEHGFERYADWASDLEAGDWKTKMREGIWDLQHVPEEFRAAAEEAFKNMTWRERRDWAEGQDWYKQTLARPTVRNAEKRQKESDKRNQLGALGADLTGTAPGFGMVPYGHKLPFAKKFSRLISGKRQPPTEKQYWSKLGKQTGVDKFYKARMSKDLYTAQYGTEAQRTYEQRVSDEIDRINEQYIPLGTEAAEREARMADRMDLYNMFLGG